MSDFEQILLKLAEGWKGAAEEVEGYRATIADGSTPQLVLQMSLTKDGNLRLSAMSFADLVSTIDLEDLGPRDGAKHRDDTPTIPYAQVELSLNRW